MVKALATSKRLWLGYDVKIAVRKKLSLPLQNVCHVYVHNTCKIGNILKLIAYDKNLEAKRKWGLWVIHCLSRCWRQKKWGFMGRSSLISRCWERKGNANSMLEGATCIGQERSGGFMSVVEWLEPLHFGSKNRTSSLFCHFGANLASTHRPKMQPCIYRKLNPTLPPQYAMKFQYPKVRTKPTPSRGRVSVEAPDSFEWHKSNSMHHLVPIGLMLTLPNKWQSLILLIKERD